MSGIDRERIADLLADETLSYRAISRLTGVSDWTVRRIARDLAGDERPMKHRYVPTQGDAPAEVSPAMGWAIFSGAIGLLGFMIWAAVRFSPPPDF